MSDTDSSNSIPSTPEWFTQFDQLTYNSNAGIKSNFNRLAKALQWGTRLKMSRWIECQATVFDSLYGTDTTKLETWQELCREIHVDEVPSSITGCKKILGSRSVLVNLVNLIDHRLTGAEVTRFPNYDTFWKYTSKGRKFPLGVAKKDGFIKTLLRKL